MSKRHKRHPRIGDARRIADEVGADAVIVIAFGRERMAGASYGQTRAICTATGRVLDRLLQALGEGDIHAGELVDALDGLAPREVTEHRCGMDEPQSVRHG